MIVTALGVLAAACGSGGPTTAEPAAGDQATATSSTTAVVTSPPAPPVSTGNDTATASSGTAADTTTEIVLASGTVEIPGARAFGDPGFHEPLEIGAPLPEGADRGGRLVLRLFDAGRPDITCESEHPLSGCVTVDWSDFADRPGVPPGGVFDNHLRVTTADGPRVLYLSETGGLAPAPDDYAPG